MIQFVFRTTMPMTLAPVYDVLANCDSQFDLEQDHERASTFPLEHLFTGLLQGRPDIMEGAKP